MSYESDLLRDWYLLFHYGTPQQIVEGSAFSEVDLPAGCLDFPVATTGVFTRGGDRALDLGCAVGRSSFELRKAAPRVIGIDFSASFIEAARQMRHEGSCSCRRFGEMHLAEEIEVVLDDTLPRDGVEFEVGDAMDLRPDLGSFDLVHAANLICRLPEPDRFFRRLPHLVNSGGQLVLATPATWLPEHTPPRHIPGGPTLDFLRDELSGAFDFVEVREVPFLIREHRRKFQLSTSQTSLWVRR